MAVDGDRCVEPDRVARPRAPAYPAAVRLLPSEPLAVASALPAATVLAAIAPAIDALNRTAIIFGLWAEVDDGRVTVGSLPRLAFLRGGVAFEGQASREGERTVVSGDIRIVPRGYARFTGGLLVAAGLMPLAADLGGPDRWASVLGAAWMFGGGRLALELLFRAYRRRIVRVLRAAADGVPTTP